MSAARDELSSGSILVASCLFLSPKQREVKVAPIGRRKTDIYLCSMCTPGLCTFLHSVWCAPSLLRSRQIISVSKSKALSTMGTIVIELYGSGSAGFIVLEYPGTKIRAESSSNGSELRSAGFTPHKIRAELSSNGSSQPASDKKSELRAHQMAPAG